MGRREQPVVVVGSSELPFTALLQKLEGLARSGWWMHRYLPGMSYLSYQGEDGEEVVIGPTEFSWFCTQDDIDICI